jgi:cysteinyl-tRNA synthetase
VVRIYNTLTNKVEELVTLEPGVARMYSCGPTVYRYAHVGNLRTYLMADCIRRLLIGRGYKVTHVKNITDVGHMRQEALETGGDKVIVAALAEGKTPQEIARFYATTFYEDERKLNILPADHFPWATDHVPEMIAVIQRLFTNGYAYQAGDNIYFDVSKFSGYGKLSGNVGADLMEGVRVEVDPLKKDPRDFTLWKAAEPGRDMKWDSPWGEGFPGWHIECSAMSTKYMGLQLDLHTGGVDNIFPHHEDEIAQKRGRIRGALRPTLGPRSASAGRRGEDGQVGRKRVHPRGPGGAGVRPHFFPLPVLHCALQAQDELHVLRAPRRRAGPDRP